MYNTKRVLVGLMMYVLGVAVVYLWFLEAKPIANMMHAATSGKSIQSIKFYLFYKETGFVVL